MANHFSHANSGVAVCSGARCRSNGALSSSLRNIASPKALASLASFNECMVRGLGSID
ncbi:hypothetical protein [Burkholderia stagnalis]|uniref:hypothetical protein n=1 Tax=Burkholderia stagnalis TaxID=1503054 RepID=UPI001E6514AB|nr:hypothetical protein [Burkholderia stagnalis]